eukprot:scaffold145170_cov127-Phaeocystis_antarctica.AAC.9
MLGQGLASSGAGKETRRIDGGRCHVPRARCESKRQLRVRGALCARADQRVGLVGQGRHSNRTSVRVHQHFGGGSLAKRPGLLPSNCC